MLNGVKHPAREWGPLPTHGYAGTVFCAMAQALDGTGMMVYAVDGDDF